MSVASFYGGDHKGSVFGYSAEYGSDFHYGQDIKRHPSGTPIPSLSSGRIVRSEWQSGHGWFVSVDSGDGWFWTYSHMDAQGFPVGTVVSIGTSLGSLGSTGQSTGPHTHVQRTRNSSPWVHGTEVDPWPQIVQILTSQAGGGTRPIGSKGNRDMLMIHTPDAGAARGVRYAVYGGGFWFEFTTGDPTISNGFANQVGASSVPVDAAFWEYCKRSSQLTTNVDSAAIAKAVSEAVESALADLDITVNVPEQKPFSLRLDGQATPVE